MKESIGDAVRRSYAGVAREGLGSSREGIRSIAGAFGYSDQALDSIPDEANMGLSCGNPVAIASLKPGETVVDLGSGGGLDVFLASREVGPEGLAIGIDMTADMVSLARANAEKGDYTNVKFYLAEIEAMPILSASVDCVISNCVLNLCEDKDVALAEVFRILKPGGRLAISDIALKKPLAPEFAPLVAAWIGCIGGALTIEDNEAALHRAGFSDIWIEDSKADLNAYLAGNDTAGCGPETSCCGSAPGEAQPGEFHQRMSELLHCVDANEYAASVKMYALKPL